MRAAEGSDNDSAETFYDLLNRIAVALAQVRDREALATAMHYIVDELFGVEYSGLFYYDPYAHTLRFAYSSGFSEQEQRELERSVMDRLPGQVFREKRTIMVPDVEAHHDRIVSRQPKGQGVQSRLHVPVLYRDACVGVLAMASRRKHFFSERHMKLASFVAQMTGVVYGNLMHLDELDHQLHTIQSQRAEILDLTAPTLDLGRGMLLLPLIGRMTAEKTAHAEQHALEAITRKRVGLVIIDLTGVEGVDTETARLLSHLAGALRMLGAKCYFSGLNPKTASSLVDIGFAKGRGVRFFGSVATAMAAAFN